LNNLHGDPLAILIEGLPEIQAFKGLRKGPIVESIIANQMKAPTFSARQEDLQEMLIFKGLRNDREIIQASVDHQEVQIHGNPIVGLLQIPVREAP
jgi:hypothetical protein